MVKVSIIIPVYNAAAHLEECVASLLKQTMIDCEFIFVNDGSTDDSKKIIESFQNHDERIKLINQENEGVSSARNKGITKAIGIYLSFVDADDYINNDFIEKLFSTAVNYNVDVVISNFNTEMEGVVTKNKPLFQSDMLFKSKEIQEKIVPFFIEQDTMNTACNKMYKASLIKDNTIFFPRDMTLGEDGLFNIQVFNKSNSVIFIDYNGYFYREVPNSATRNSSKIDYFKVALEKFNINYKTEYNIDLDNEKVIALKSIRLVNTVISLIHIYAKSTNSFRYKYKYISNMISNANVQKALQKYWNDLFVNQPKYKQYILYCIKLKSVLLLFLATSYSNFRNK